MAHFRGTVQGSRGQASRLGGKSSGLVTSCDGWDIGITSNLHHSDTYGDVATVYITSGSGYGDSLFIGKFYKDDDGKIKRID